MIGISPDDIEIHNRFSEAYGLQFPLIADKNNAIRKMYLPGRITFLIDKEGVIRYIEEGMPEMKNFLDALKKLNSR